MKRFKRGNRKHCTKIPFLLQLFAEPGAGASGSGAAGGAGASGADTGGSGGAGGSGTGTPPSAGQTPPASVQPPASGAAPAIDYDKLAQLVAGKQALTEDSVLKGYFKQQGLSQEEMNQAIAAFKQQKAASQPDVNAIQSQLVQAQEAAQQAQIQSAATMAAVSLGIEVKAVPYILKMADLSQVMGPDGKVKEDAVKNTLNQVLEAIPALKPQPAGTSGFQIGAAGGTQGAGADQAALKKAFGL